MAILKSDSSINLHLYTILHSAITHTMKAKKPHKLVRLQFVSSFENINVCRNDIELITPLLNGNSKIVDFKFLIVNTALIDSLNHLIHRVTLQ